MTRTGNQDERRAELTSEQLTQGSELCTSCGLCCMGALHDAAALDEVEIAGARDLGLPVLNRAKPGFKLPCPKLVGTDCSIYGERPRACARYRCGLLQRLDAGDVGLDQALGIVRTAKSLIGKLEQLAPGEMTLPQARALALAGSSDGALPTSGVERGAAMRLRLAATAASVYIDQQFRNAREGRSFSVRVVSSEREMKGDEPAI